MVLTGRRCIHFTGILSAQGLVGSQTTLALIYEEGKIVAQDLDKARKWYQAAGFDEK